MFVDKGLLLRKGINFFLGLGSNFAVLYSAARMYEPYHQSALLFSSGIMSYALLADFGFGRPIYARLRDSYLNEAAETYSEMYSFSLLYIAFAFLVLLLIVTAALEIHSIAWHVRASLLPLTMAIGLMNILTLALFRDLHEAVSNNNWYEKADGARRLLIIVCSVAGALLHTLWVYALTMAVLSSILLLACLLKYLSFRPHPLLAFHAGFFHFIRRQSANVRESATHNFCFRMGEVLLYNWGYLVYSGDHGLRALVAYSVWQRLFIGISTPTRILQDSAVPSFTEKWFRNEKNPPFDHLLTRSFLITAFVSVLFVGCGKQVISVLTKGEPMETTLLICACLVWSFSNVLQHLAGTYLLSINRRLDRLSNTTLLFLMIGSASTYLATLVLGRSVLYRPELLLLYLGVLYAGYALTQFMTLIQTTKAARTQ